MVYGLIILLCIDQGSSAMVGEYGNDNQLSWRGTKIFPLWPGFELRFVPIDLSLSYL